MMSDENRTYMIQPICTINISYMTSLWALSFNSCPHLKYSIKKDAAFCLVCHLFPVNPDQRIPGDPSAAWTLNGVHVQVGIKWKGVERRNFTTSELQEALDALLAFQNKTTHIDMLLIKIVEKSWLKALLDVASTLGHKRISFRGSSNETDGKGNFRQIVSLVSMHSSSLKSWLDNAENCPDRVNYLSSRSQNEFLTLQAEDMSVELFLNSAKLKCFLWFLMFLMSAVVARYLGKEGVLQERLVDIKEIHDNTVETMLNKFFPILMQDL